VIKQHLPNLQYKRRVESPLFFGKSARMRPPHGEVQSMVDAMVPAARAALIWISAEAAAAVHDGTLILPARLLPCHARQEILMSKQPSRPASAGTTGRGQRAGFDRKTGEVSGSGAGIGNPASSEDYDDDISVGSGSDRRTGGPSNAA
jgi:hypothetical protein